MRNLLKHIFILSSLLSPLLLKSQEKDPQLIIEGIIESHLAAIDEETDVALIIEDLQDLAEHPINLNSCTEAELARLYLLNPLQIGQLQEFVKKYGPVYSIFELSILPGFTQDLLEKMQAFIFFGSPEKTEPTFKEALQKGRHEILARSLGVFQRSDGYQTRENGDIPYEGNPMRYYSRYRFEVREKLSLGLTAEKDPGEAFFKASNPHGFDYYSGHASWTPGKIVQQINIGDFVVRSGQGLSLWQGYTTGKSPDVLAISKTGQGLRPYSSVNENAFFRGIAASFKSGKNTLELFFSHKRVDGNVKTDKNENRTFSSLQTSGYHRTQSETDDEKSVKMTDAGAVYQLRFSSIKIGASFVYTRFDLPFVRSPQLYNQFLFAGEENYSASADYLFNSGKFEVFGEAAFSKSGGKAFLQGAVLRLNDRLNFSVLYRRFDKDYHAFWANTFADGTNTNNEAGLYFGLRFLPAKFISLSAYSDLYRSEWYSFQTAGPSQGWDFLTQIDVKPSTDFGFYVRFKIEENEKKTPGEKLQLNQPEQTRKIRLHFEYRVSEKLSMNTRFESVNFKGTASENGFLVFHDIKFQTEDSPLQLSARVAWFKTDSYNSRIYAYENDLLYTFSVPALYGKGVRGYINLRYRITDKIDGWLKFGNTLWTDRETIGSGYGEIQGRNKSELKIQLRLKF